VTFVGFKLRILLSLAAAAMAASIATLAAVSVGAARPSLPWTRPGPCIQVDVVASTEKADLIGTMAAAFNGAGYQQDGRCVRVQVHKMDSGATEQALARGWDARRDSGGAPYSPTAWTPASSAWLSLLQEAYLEQGRPRPVQSLGSVASTPLVLAMPRPMAEALGWPAQPIGWADVLALAGNPAGWASLGHPEWGAFRLGKTDPDFSTSGLHALIATYFAATGLTSGLGPASVESAATAGYVARIEQSAVHYGSDTETFLANLQAADDAGRALSYISAVTIEEKSVWDYNQGNPSGRLDTVGQHPRPKVQLVAVYPREGTLFSDSPYSVLDEPWVSAAQRDGANLFFQYLRGADRQGQFEARGFRPADGSGRPFGPQSRITQASGLLPNQPQVTLRLPDPAVLAEIQADWHRIRKRARLLVVLDTSPAMAQPVPGAGGARRFDLARQALTTTLANLAPDDEVGLAGFPAAPSGGLPTLVGVGPVDQVGELVRATAFGIQDPADLTSSQALYDVVAQAVAGMSAPGSYDPARINAVLLLTDGGDNAHDGIDPGQLVTRLQATDEAHNVPVFAIAYSDMSRVPDSLARITAAARGSASLATTGSSAENVVAQVVGNF
jgi:Ca-activated chloride channel homolog